MICTHIAKDLAKYTVRGLEKEEQVESFWQNVPLLSLTALQFGVWRNESR